MKKLAAIVSVVFIASAPGVSFAQVDGECVANVNNAAAANGDVVDAEAVCLCMKGEIDKNPSLLEEIEAAGGLPSPGEASDDFKTAFEGCRA